MHRNIPLKKAGLYVLFFIFSFQLTGKEPDLNFTTFTSRDGLSSNTVNSVLEDHFGFLWIATEDGLNRFDGTSFKVYRHISGQDASLPVNHVTSLFEDSDGSLWVATNGGAVSIYDRNKDEFVNLTAYNPSVVNMAATSISEDRLGNIWIGSYNGLFVVNRATRKVIRIYREGKAKGDLHTNIIIALFRDSRKNMWIGTNAGLYRHDKSTGKFTRVLNSIAEPGYILSLAEDKKGRILAGTMRGLYVLSFAGKQVMTLTHGSGSSNISSDIVYAVKTAKDGLVWLGTEEGLNVVNIDSGLVYKYRADRRNRSSLRSKSIRSICFDANGIGWVGTFQGGVSKYDQNYTSFKVVESNPFDANGLSAPVVTSFAEYPGKGVFVGTDGGGVDLFQPNSGRFTHYQVAAGAVGRSNKRLSVLALEMTKDNKLWVGTFLDGVYVVDVKTGSRTHLIKGEGPSNLNFSDVFCIREDRKGNVWVGTNGGGVNLYNPSTGLIEKLLHNPAKPEDRNHLSHLVIRALEEDRNGNMWIGTFGGGISVRNPRTRRFTFYSKEKNGLPNNYIITIKEDSKGNIWVGTNGGGLSLLDRKSGRFVTYSEKDGLVNDGVQTIVEDKDGKIWLSTNKGISSFDPLIRKFKNYSHHNGLQNSPFVLGAGLCMSDGTLFFGGQEGFNYFDPSVLRMNRNIPPVVLTNLRVNNSNVIPSDDGPLKQSILIAKEIDLRYKDNFSITFVALNYTISEQNQYEYRLKGVDKDWIQAGKEHTAYYTNLDPGEYIFEVRASNNDGIWNKKGRSVIINVSPPFWRTIYAYIFYVFSIIGTIFWIRYRGIKKLEMKFALEKERIEARQLIEQERRQAEHLHQMDLMKIKFLTNLSHEFRTPLSLIVGPVESLIEKISEPAFSSQLSLIRRNGRRLMNLVNQLLDFRKMEEQELKLHLAAGDIISFSRDIADSFCDVASRKNISFKFSADIPNAFVLFDHDKIERILFNLLSNAFKFTQEGGEILVEIIAREEESSEGTLVLDIIVSDSGIGIPSEAQRKLFDRFFQHDPGPLVLNQGTGIGLSIVKEFTKMHGGTVDVQSELRKGSSFVVSIPFALPETGVDGIEERHCREAAIPTETEGPIPNQQNRMPDGASVLIVEDDDDFRFYIKDNLKLSYRIYEATNGKEGWQRALAHHPDIIVCDVNMPVMSGIELSRKLKADKRTSHIPLILLTASTLEDEQIKGLESGANDYMTKPFNFAVLNVKLKNLLMLNQTLKDTYVKQVKVLPPAVEIQSENEKLINKVLVYIEENLNNPQLSVEGMARSLLMSRASLYNKITEITGMSPVEFIRSAKLDRAIILLEQSDLTIAQIAYQVGFSTPNYFARAFKAKYNIVPSEYLAKKRKLQPTEY
ncbi:hybrid sensor histidine kinase/response regulator transcription factor [Arcticibacter tournemirensis]|uniref:histidine kinase n=1 Tax=Arcticibacter tournemirensis TaxID=699437 RepID=A0A4Q0M5C0_9SPHI|nr:hybrid sensor histidine kinase/response regulator transcription factor [Arcticibacter tournemirensis]RXF68190.1 hybrid sensor histidine kinase/response regulator [Arcticibacter tournemirensis]